MDPLRFPPTPRSDPTRPPAPVVALHCSGAGGRVYAGYRALLPDDVVLMAPDLLGSGAEPPWPVGVPASLDDEARRLAPLIAGGGGVHLLGHSYGGAVALQMALRWPEHVRSLTLYEPVRFRLLERDPALYDDIVGVGHEIGALALAGELRASGRRFVDYWSGDGTWDALPPARQAAVAARMTKVQAEFEAIFDDPVPPSAFGALRVPTTVLAGDRSPLPAQRVAERLATLCPHAMLVRLRGRGHMGALEDPAAVRAWLPVVGAPGMGAAAQASAAVESPVPAEPPVTLAAAA